MKGFFSYDGYLNQLLTKVMYVVSANLLFVICCIPVITVGASCTAMYTVIIRYIQGDEPDILKTFFRAFKENFRNATKVWSVMLVTAVTLGGNYYLLFHLQGLGAAAGVIRVLLNFVLMALLAFGVYIFPSMCYYKNSLTGYVYFSAGVAIAQLPRTFLLLFLNIVPLLLVLFLAQYLAAGVWLFLCCGFALPAYLSSGILIKIFARYEEKNI